MAFATPPNASGRGHQLLDEWLILVYYKQVPDLWPQLYLLRSCGSAVWILWGCFGALR